METALIHHHHHHRNHFAGVVDGTGDEMDFGNAPSLDDLHETLLNENTSINKNLDAVIVQIVDIVKSHLVYAVREEFCMLKGKIYDLEQKVEHLESENRLLRQFAPSHVVERLDSDDSGVAIGDRESLSSPQSPDMFTTDYSR